MLSEEYPAEKEEKFMILKKRAERVKEVLSDTKYKDAWDVYPFNSGYFMWDVYPFNSGYFMCIRLKSVDAERLRVHLLDKYGVGLISIDNENLRVAFSCVEESDIKELFDIILQGVKDLSA